MVERVVALWVAFVQGELAFVQVELAFVQGEFAWVCMCSVGAPLVCCFGSFALCVPTAWSPSCLPCEESVRALLSSDLVCLVFGF